MNVRVICSVIFLCFVVNPCSVHGDNVGGCIVQKKYSDVLPRITPLTGQNFQVENSTYRYNISICTDVASDRVNASVTQYSADKNSTIVLGRRNETEIIAGSSWILLSFGSGDQVNVPCSGQGRAEIVITCSNVPKPTLILRDVAENHGSSVGCSFIFDLVTPPFPNCSVLEHNQPKVEGLSNGSVFCIIVLTTFGVYLAVGIFYRRLVKGAKGFEQIPHADFWRKLGNLQADGCDFACRRGNRREESWQRLTNNFNDSQDDKDDALLQP